MTALQLPDPGLPWPIPMAGVALIAEFEGLRLAAYKCPAGVWTCGWGETAGVGPKTRWAKNYADQRFCDSLGERTEAVQALVTVETSDNQLAALVSLAYNIGNQALAASSVLRAHNRGDVAAAARAFALWNKARVGGALTVLPGLVSRRAREAALYLTPDADATIEPMPQAVAPESSLARSPMMAAGGAVPVVTGVVSAAAEAVAPSGAPGDSVAAMAHVGQQAGMVQTVMSGIKGLMVDTIGIPSSWWLPIVLIAGGLTVMYWRRKQRTDGWA